MAKFKLKQGDVFSIPMGDSEVGYGQIVVFLNTKDVFMMCLFDCKNVNYPENELETICNSPIVFLGYSTDAKLYYKDWEILGNFTNNLSEIKLPYHKLGLPPDDMHLVNFKGERLREISEDVFNQLNYQTTYAPIRYENAIKAYYGLIEWKKDDYDKLLYKQTLKSIEIASNVLS